MVTAVSIYGIAPYGWDQMSERETVLKSDLALDTEERIIIPNVWLGPSQQSLVLLGALYGKLCAPYTHTVYLIFMLKGNFIL